MGTSQGVRVLEQRRDKWHEVAHGIDLEISALVTRGDTIYAGTYGHGIYVSTDRGSAWREWNSGLEFPFVRALALDPRDADLIYAGTEPAALYAARPGEAWSEIHAVRALPGATEWSLPYSPRAGALRSFDFLADGTLVGAVEVGGVIWKADRAGWQINARGLHPDVHAVAHDGEWVLAATGGGIYRTREIGKKWERVENDYTRALLVLPDLILAGPAKSVGERGRIIASRDHGATWTGASDGLQIPIPTMFEHFLAFGDGLFAVTEAGEVYHSPRDEIRWTRVLEEIPNVHPIAVL